VNFDYVGEKINNDENTRRFKAGLASTPEGRILITGLAITILCIVFLVISLFWKPEIAEILVAMISTDIAFGWITSMSLGYTIGLNNIQIILITMFIETTLVLLFYPLFVFSWKKIIVIRVLKSIIDRIGKGAEKFQKPVQKYGIWGLFIFTWAPFWMTGPVVGSAIGFLIGLHPLHNLAIVISATYVAIMCWALVLGKIHTSVAGYGPLAPLIFLSIILIIIVAGNFLFKSKGAKKPENHTSESEESRR
jgi:uncharacterized membrane protein